MNYYDEELKEVYKELNTTDKGLSSEEVEKRLEKYGPNTLKEKKGISPIILFLQQFNSPVVWILIAALIVSFFLGERVDSYVILTILILNAILGFVQEYNAEKEIEALKKLSGLKAIVLRDGKEQEIESSKLVPGDVIILAEGSKIPADSRIIESVMLEAQESALTGESLPVKKISERIQPNKDLGDQKNMIFSGTVITRGRGIAIVTRTGMESEIGKIATLIQETKKIKTPLQEKLAKMGGFLSILTVIICVVVFTTGMLRGGNLLEIFTMAVALAVAAIPEGLPAVVTIGLSVGLRRMLKKNALIRKLPSVETLGSTTVICSDKTGTLTHNQMTITKIFANDNVIDVNGSGYKKEGEFSDNPENFELLLRIGALCNDSKIDFEKNTCIGDPTEGCLIVSAEKAKYSVEDLNEKYPRINEVPFSSERKRMTTLHKVGKKNVAYLKGAPDVILELCDSYYKDGTILPMTKKMKDRILKANLTFSNNALRVLGFAFKEIKDPKKFTEKDENKLTFVGLQGMMDPPRKEVKDAITKCHSAGIKVVMITGDYAGTAIAIANELGIKGKNITGKDLEKMSDKEFEHAVEEISIYARVNPAHKQRIVDALQKHKHVVAMTGDGVNDAPALKKADIGIAMGISGTDVAKEASDMILTDDNFASIVNAIREGRGVFDNIKKFFAFLLSGNIGEVLIIFILILFGFPAPLTATQILLVNLVTDGLPATALSIDPFEPHAMTRKPRKRTEKIQNGLGNFLIGYPILMILTAIILFVVEFNTTGNLAKARTFAFLTIVFFELYQAFASRSTIYPSLKVGLFKNKALIAAVLLSLVVAIGVVYIPSIAVLFGTTALGIGEFLLVALLSCSGFIYLEVSKAIKSSKLPQ